MASSANAITPPEGYTLEAAPTPQPKAAPAGITPPPGYALEAPTSPAPKGPTIGPQPNASQADVSLPESVAPAPLQKLTMPLVKGLIAAHDKLKEVENMTQEGQQAHPIQAHIGALANRIEGLLTGNPTHPEAGIGTGEEGLLTNPVTASLIPGAGGTPALAEGLEAGANAVKEGYQAVKGGAQAAKDLVTGGEGPNIVRQAIKGKGVAQEPAQAAIREAAGAADDAVLLEGNKTILDERLNNLKQQEAAAYKKLDDKAGFDVKEARIRLKNDQYKIKQLGNTDTDVAQREKLTAAIKDTSDRIAGAGVDTTEADNLHKSRKAGEEVKKLLVRSLGPDGKTINVDTFLNGAKNLRTISKYGDRFEQFFGKEATEGLINDLQEAQKAGKKALSVQKIAKWGLGGLGTVLTTGEAVKHVLP
jgi:hypothetical protein